MTPGTAAAAEELVRGTDPERAARDGAPARDIARPGRVGELKPLRPTRTRAALGSALGPLWGRANLFAGAFAADLPSPQAIFGLRGGLARGALYGELHGSMSLPSERGVEGGGKVRVRTEELGAALCLQWGKRLRGGPCAHVSVLRSLGSSRGIVEPVARRVALWGRAGLSALVGLRLGGPWELLLEAGAALPVSGRPSFAIAGQKSLSAGFVSGQVTFGAGVRWP